MSLALIRSLVIVSMLALLSAWAHAKQAVPLASDPALEARVMQVAEELRCLVCQNETLAASQADLAVDLRRQIRSQLQQGRTAAQIVDFMVERYGVFVRYRPPLEASTLLLWAGPFVLLIGAGLGLARKIRTRQADDGQRVLSDVDVARAEALLATDAVAQTAGAPR